MASGHLYSGPSLELHYLSWFISGCYTYDIVRHLDLEVCTIVTPYPPTMARVILILFYRGPIDFNLHLLLDQLGDEESFLRPAQSQIEAGQMMATERERERRELSQNGSDGDNGNGGNGYGGNNRNGNPNENGRGAMLVARVCTYQDFVKCQPLNFKGTKGFVGLTRWFEKMETVSYISNCPEVYQVKDLTKLMTEVYCPRNEIKKMETELWNLTVKNNDLAAYT
ncbi:hypothetical protein Tco_0850662 [Tanacetum coccineum]